MNRPLLTLTASVLIASASAQAQAITQTEALTRLLSAPELRAEWFSPDFLAQVPFETIAAQLRSLPTQFGRFVRMDTLQGQPLAVYGRGTLVVTVASLDDQGRLTAFGAVPGPASAAADPAAAQSEQAKVASLLEGLFKVEPLDLSLISPSFLEQVSADELSKTFAAIRAGSGALQNVQIMNAGYRLTFEKGAWEASGVGLDDQGRFTSLLLRPAAPDISYASLDEARAAFAALPGQVSLLVQEVGQPQPLADLNSRKLLAVGSAFKLAILGELQAQVTRGEKQWTDEVTLTDADRSLPSGTLQDAPSGSRYTLRDLAARMISQSDNTATDLLLKAVGRQGVEARLGQTAMPSTREAFALKNPANIELLRAYRSAGLDRDARREVLEQATAAPLPNAGLFAQGKTVAQDVEWFVSAQRLCRLMANVASLPETQLNPGVAAPADFERVSFKGGSEIGVINLTTQVTTKAGRTLCVSATWNRPEPLEEQIFVAMYAAVLKLLR
ncbi:serine hydrolase [Deinococcus humi]|uniref:Beta-lactamase class A n=1 Tax=Deinococcus humi TaxID=662880 RepID=A0A7W8JUT0_9DEIO|nr:serine hydrolase [Deinococcus humi]MBB5362034.1 beta-lactamase class A [Deinococcus humi]GGO22396.1 serine hydrolase [Deinococcus humi]